MIAAQPLSTKKRSLFCWLMMCLSPIVLFSFAGHANSEKNTFALSLSAIASRVNNTPQVNYTLSINPKVIVATPALAEMPSVSISADFRVNPRVRINNEEHFVTTYPSSTENSVTLETQAADGASAHRYRIYPNKARNEGRSFYIKDEFSGATFFATTNDTITSLSIKQAGNDSTDGMVDDGGRFGGVGDNVIAGIIMGFAIVLIVTVSVLVHKFCNGSGIISLHSIIDAAAGSDCDA